MKVFLALIGLITLQGCGFLIMNEETFNLGTPSQALTWISEHITYKEDIGDRWQLPSETLRLGTGDCEDLAVLFMSALKAQGIESKAIGIIVDWNPAGKEGHVVVQWNNQWYTPELGINGSMPIGSYPKMWERTFQECLHRAYDDNKEGKQ